MVPLSTILSSSAALVNVGAPEEPLSLSFFSLTLGRKALAGSCIGGIPEAQEMLGFCAEIELICADQINEAYERVLNSDVHYRFVIDNATI